jgi:hypothetical protein
MGTPKTNDGRPRLAVEKGDASKKNFFSHDWTDPTTWYSTATRVVDEVATDSGDHLTYNLANANAIDTYHGKLFSEDYLKDANGNNYRVAAKVNGTAKTEQDPHAGTGGDFTVNYALGKIIFLSALAPSDEVKVTYHKKVDSTFIVKPDACKNLMINFAEIQFSADLIITDSVSFQPYGLADVFAPQYVPSPFPSGTLIPLGSPVIYKTIRDFQTEAVKAYPAYPAMGGSGWRGMTQDVIIMDWDYVSSTQLRSDCGMEVRLKLVHDAPFGGTYATCSFYCTSEDT